MSTLTWSPALALQQPEMDATHQEFVTLLARVESLLGGAEDQLLRHWEALVDHTVDHFGQEDAWMAATGFAPDNCHTYQHQAVLGVMIECAHRARGQGDFAPLRLAVGELATWFPQHALSMDAALAQHLRASGFDPATGTAAPELATAEVGTTASVTASITGCGSARCG